MEVHKSEADSGIWGEGKLGPFLILEKGISSQQKRVARWGEITIKYYLFVY